MTDEGEKDIQVKGGFGIGKNKQGHIGTYLIGGGDDVLSAIKSLGKPEETIADILKKRLKEKARKRKSDKKR